MLSDSAMGPSLSAGADGLESGWATWRDGGGPTNPLKSFNLTSIPANLPHANHTGGRKHVASGRTGFPAGPGRARARLADRLPGRGKVPGGSLPAVPKRPPLLLSCRARVAARGRPADGYPGELLASPPA